MCTTLCIQAQFGWGFEQPDHVEDVPAHCRGLELGDLLCFFQPKPFCILLCVSVINIKKGTVVVDGHVSWQKLSKNV